MSAIGTASLCFNQEGLVAWVTFMPSGDWQRRVCSTHLRVPWSELPSTPRAAVISGLRRLADELESQDSW